MATIDITQNFMSPKEFRFSIERLPHVTYFAQDANIPGISANPTVTQTPFKEIYTHGDRLTWNTFSVTVRIDENMNNFIEIFNWMQGLTYPDEFDQYANLVKGDGLYSDATLTVLSNAKNPNVEFRFKDIFPISMGDVILTVQDVDIEYATTEITFQTNGYTIHQL